MEEGVIALVGTGKGGLALLKVLLGIPGVKIKYVCDVNPDAVGYIFAENHDIKCVTDYNQILSDNEINLIFEATGNPCVFKRLSEKKSSNVSLIGAGGSKIIYNFLDAYNEVNRNLNEYKINLEKKIIERTEELEKANVRLEKEMLEYEKISDRLHEINEEKTKYLLFATHQLKAPFAAIQSYVDIILDGYSGEIPETTRGIVVKIKERCELLSVVIKEMLELEKLKSRESLSFQKIDIAKILPAVIKRFKVISNSKNITINFAGFNEAFYIKGDGKQIDILFSILLENAINYSHPSTSIEIIVRKMPNNQLYVGFKDYGIGISEENLSRIFNEFFRSNNAVAFHKNGTGLGLSIVKEIAAIHNTNIHVESIIGKGSCFSMIFQLI